MFLIVPTPLKTKLKPRKMKWLISSGVAVYDRQILSVSLSTLNSALLLLLYMVCTAHSEICLPVRL